LFIIIDYSINRYPNNPSSIITANSSTSVNAFFIVFLLSNLTQKNTLDFKSRMFSNLGFSLSL